MAPSGKLKRGPQLWLENKKNRLPVASTPRGTGGGALPEDAVDPDPAQSGGKELLSPPSKQARAPKKMPPPADPCAEVLAEHAALSRRSSQSSHANAPAPTRHQPNTANTASAAVQHAATDPHPTQDDWRKSPNDTPDKDIDNMAASNDRRLPSPARAAVGTRRRPDSLREVEAERYDLSSGDERDRQYARRDHGSYKRRAYRSPSPHSSDDFSEFFSRKDHHRRQRRRSRSQSRSSYSPHSDHHGRGYGSGGRRRRDSHGRRPDYDLDGRKSRENTSREAHGSGGSSRRRHRSPSWGTPPPTRSGASSGLLLNSGGKPVLVKKENVNPNNTDSVKSYKHRSRIQDTFTLNRESALRKERREREAEREEDAQHRESRGKKPYLIHVNTEGKPYGLGTRTWNDVLAKVVRGLDPSYIDIRQQPCHLMDTMLKRLDEEFDYCDTINASWLRARIGNALSSYRHELMKMIQAGESRPPWVSESIWEKLVKMESSEKFKQKSEAMKYAQSCRRTYGRTGPIGEAGIIERLRKKLRRSPAPDEVFEEMHRDKGYGGRSRKLRHIQQSSTHSGDEEESLAEGDQHGNLTPPSSAEPAPENVNHGVCQTASDIHDSPNVGVERQTETVHGVQPSMPDLHVNPLVTLLRKQIDEILKSSAATSEEAQFLVSTLRLQLTNIQGKSSSQGGVSLQDEPSPVHGAASSADIVSREGVGRGVAEGAVAPNPLQEIVAGDDPRKGGDPQSTQIDPKPMAGTRKSTRNYKKKVRTDSGQTYFEAVLRPSSDL